MAIARLLLIGVVLETPALADELPAGAVRRLGSDAFRPGGRPVDVSADGKYIAVIDDEHRMKVVAMSDGAVVRSIPATPEVADARFADGGKSIRVLSAEAIRTWQIDPWKLVAEVPVADTRHTPVRFTHPDMILTSRSLAEGSETGLLDARTGKLVTRYPSRGDQEWLDC